MLGYVIGGVIAGGLGWGISSPRGAELGPGQRAFSNASAIILMASIAAGCGWGIQSLFDSMNAEQERIDKLTGSAEETELPYNP